MREVALRNPESSKKVARNLGLRGPEAWGACAARKKQSLAAQVSASKTNTAGRGHRLGPLTVRAPKSAGASGQADKAQRQTRGQGEARYGSRSRGPILPLDMSPAGGYSAPVSRALFGRAAPTLRGANHRPPTCLQGPRQISTEDERPRWRPSRTLLTPSPMEARPSGPKSPTGGREAAAVLLVPRSRSRMPLLPPPPRPPRST